MDNDYSIVDKHCHRDIQAILDVLPKDLKKWDTARSLFMSTQQLAGYILGAMNRFKKGNHQ